VFKRALLAAIVLAVSIAGIEARPTQAAGSYSEAAAVEQFAARQLNKPFRLGANGMEKFDCSGLVYRTFVENGLLRRIGGQQRAAGYYRWFRDRDLLTNNPRPGDLVVWGRRGHPVEHIGIFIGYNKNGGAMAISALTSGVARHRVNGISMPFRAYLRVNLDR
jgi:cell wall-associated NlpC family hydrolase